MVYAKVAMKLELFLYPKLYSFRFYLLLM